MDFLSCETEIDQFDLSRLLVYHNVMRLDISMRDPIGVTVSDGQQKIAYPSGSFVLREFTPSRVIGQLIKQVLTVALLHYQIQVVRVLVCVVISHDIGMVKSLENGYLLSDCRQFTLAHFGLVQDFDGNA